MANNKIEKRFEIRAATGDEFALQGRAVRYNEVSSAELCDGVREMVMPGAFTASLAAATDIKALLNHDSTALPLGRTANGTLRITDTPDGLLFRVQLDKNNNFHQSVYASVKRADINECSFAFLCEDDDFVPGTYNGQQCTVRTVKKAQLLDCSVVTSPFYGDGATSVNARSAAAAHSDLARVLAMPADWARSERAFALGKQLIEKPEQRGNQDFMAARATKALASLNPPLELCCHDENNIYAADPDDDDNSRCMRFSYDVDDQGELTLDEDSCEECSHEVSHSVRAIRSQRKADAELRFRMRAEAGITGR